MCEYIEVNQKTIELVWDKAHELSKNIAFMWKYLSDLLPDDDSLSSSACMQMILQGIVILMSTNTALDKEDYLEPFILHLREVHARYHKGIRDRVRAVVTERLEND